MTYSAAVLADSPVGYWRLGDASGTTMADSSGGGHDGTYTGSPTLGATGLLTGDSDKAVVFNGSSQYAQVPAGAWMRGESSDDYTIECLVKYTGSATYIPISWYAVGTKIAEIATPSGGVEFIPYNTTGTGTTIVAPGTYNDGKPHMFTVTRAGNLCTLYVDGVSAASATVSSAQGATTASLTIGNRGTIDSHWFAGTIDEVSLYNHALTSTRIAAHYTAATTATATTHTATVTLTATATLSASPTRTAETTVDLAATASLAAPPTREQHIAPSLDAVASLSATALDGPLAHPTLTAAASLTAGMVRTALATASLTATAALDATAALQRVLAATLDAVATLTAETSDILRPTLQALATLTSTAIDTKPTIDGSILCDWSGLDVEIDTIPGMVDGAIAADWGGLVIHATGAAYTSTPPAIARPSFALYAADGQTWVANLPTAIGSWQEELNAPGDLTFTLPLADASAIDFGMIVKAFWQGECRFAARITSWSTDLAVDGTRWRTFDTQPGILSLLGDGVAFPEYGFDRTSGDQRTFGAMSGLDRLTDNLESDDWFQPSVWHHPAGFTMDSDTGFRAGYYTTGAPAAIRAADPSWLAMNDPYELLPGNSVMWVRRRLINYGDDFDYQILVAADNTCTLWLDGQQILDPQPTAGAGWRTTRAVTGTLTKGVHMLAAKVINKGHPSRIAFACAVQRLDDHGNVADPAWNCSRKGHSGWAVNDGTGPPFWERGQIIASLIGENAALGVDGCQLITVAIPNRVDSTGVPWNHRGEYTFDVGTSVLDVTQQLCDEGMDVALDPEDLTLRGYVRKGIDRSATVTLDLGSSMAADTENLKSYQVATVGPQWNTALMHLDDGTWVQTSDTDSVSAVGTRVQLLTLGSTADSQSATDAAAAQFAEVASTSRQVTAEPSVLIGALAYRDYQLGDTVNVPTEDGTGHMKARVLAITVDATGEVVRAWPEFIQDPT